VAFGVGDEMQVEMVRRHLVEDHPDLLRVVLANFGNEPLGRDAYIDRVALLGEETSRSEPRLKLSPVNGLLQPVEDLLPEIHRAFTRDTASGSCCSNNPQLFNNCGKSGPEKGEAKIAQTWGVGSGGGRLGSSGVES